MSFPRLIALFLLLGCLGAGAASPSVSAPPTDAELKSLLTRVLERAAKDREQEAHFDATHAYTHTKLTETKDGKGTVRKREAKTIRHEPSPLPAGANTTGTTPSAKDPQRAYEQRDFTLSEELVRRYDYKAGGSERIGGRDVVVIDFTPKSGRPARDLKDRFLSRVAGRLWVDQAEAVIVRFDARLTAEVSVVGGLAGNVKQCRVCFERERTVEGSWFTRVMDWRLEGRQFFSRKIIEHREERRDVRKVL
jgi:hypothetical protein